jgi:DNA-binding transcriptional LysR family regulator
MPPSPATWDNRRRLRRSRKSSARAATASNSGEQRPRMHGVGPEILNPRRAMAVLPRSSALAPGELDDGQTAMQFLMDSRKLLYLATVIEQGSLNKAAKSLHVSQPALSKAMDRLEDGLGVKLLERSPNGITATPFGELLSAHARLIKEELEFAATRLHNAGRSRARILAVGTLPSLACSVVPLAISRWRERYPRTVLRVTEKVQVELLFGLMRGDFDFIIGQTQFYDLLDGLRQRVIFRDRLRVFARLQHPLFRLAKPGWADLAQYPWVLPMVGGRQRTVLEKLLADEKIDLPRQLIECGSIDFTRALVAASDHLAMLPEHAVTSNPGKHKLRPLPIMVPALSRDIAVIFRESTPLDVPSRDLIKQIEMVGGKLARERTRR